MDNAKLRERQLAIKAQCKLTRCASSAHGGYSATMDLPGSMEIIAAAERGADFALHVLDELDKAEAEHEPLCLAYETAPVGSEAESDAACRLDNCNGKRNTLHELARWLEERI